MAVRRTTTSKLLVWGAVGLLLFYAHVAFIPVALALLFGLVLSGPVEALHRIRVPRSLSAALILLLVLSAFGGIAALIWTPAQDWFAKAPQTMSIIKQKVSPIAKFMTRVDELRNILYWGIAGIVLATPTLVALKVIAESTKRGRPMMEFLGSNNLTAGRDATLKKFVRRLEESSPLPQ
jgi:predicted PurR-regulated permease PerM